MSTQRVLFIHHRPQASGAARSLALLIGALGEEWEAHVVVPGGDAAELFEAVGATVHRAPVPAFTHTWDVQYRGLRWLVALRELSWVPAHVRALRRLLRELQPALVHLNDSVLLASGLVAHRARVPVVWHLRSSLANSGQDRRSRWICRVIDRTGSAAIAIDSDVARTFALEIPVTIVQNPVTATDGPTADLEVPVGEFSVGYVGYLRHQKGWPQFLEAIRLARDEGVPVHAVVVGGGVRPTTSFRGFRRRLFPALGIPDEELSFAAKVRALNLSRHLTWLPFTRDVDAVYRALDVLCFPNQGVGLGRPVLEAAAYGVPAVVSGSPDGAGLVVDGETGLLLPRGDPALIAAAVRRLADPGERARLSSAAAERSRELASPDRAARAVTATWDAL